MNANKTELSHHKAAHTGAKSVRGTEAQRNIDVMPFMVNSDQSSWSGPEKNTSTSHLAHCIKTKETY